jgi:plasmid stabilization system protein ParE
MNYKVHYTATVIEDLDQKLDHLRRERVSPELISDWFERLFDHIDSLAEWPKRFAVSEEQTDLRGREVRKTNFGEYLIFYEVDDLERRVNVIAFRHGARDINSLTD